MITENIIVERLKKAVNELEKPPYYKEGDDSRD